MCKTCCWWKEDQGVWCFNGWSGDGTNGHCHKEVNVIPKKSDDFCSHHDGGNHE